MSDELSIVDGLPVIAVPIDVLAREISERESSRAREAREEAANDAGFPPPTCARDPLSIASLSWDLGAGITVHHGEALAVLRSLPSDSVDALITDPPYSSGGQYRGDRTIDPRQKYISSDSSRQAMAGFSGDGRDARSFAYWCALWSSEALRIVKPGGVIVQFSDWRQVPSTTDAIQAGGWVWRGLGVWTKPRHRPSKGRFSSSTEFWVWGSRGEMPTERGVGCLVGDWRGHVADDERDFHATTKPIGLMRHVVEICPRGGVVLDPFAGSGSTLVAAKETGRRAIGIEIDPVHIDTIRQRLAQACMLIPAPAIEAEPEQEGLFP